MRLSSSPGSRLVLAAALVLCAAAACSGSGDTTPFGSGTTSGTSDGGASTTSTTGAGGSAGGSTTTTSSTTTGVGGAGGAGHDCSMLQGDCKSKVQMLRMLLHAAQICDPASPVEPCQDVIDGPCCPVPVADKDSPEAQCFLEALDAVKAACGDFGCPAEPCADPKKQCLPDSGQASTICQ